MVLQSVVEISAAEDNASAAQEVERPANLWSAGHRGTSSVELPFMTESRSLNKSKRQDYKIKWPGRILTKAMILHETPCLGHNTDWLRTVLVALGWQSNSWQLPFSNKSPKSVVEGKTSYERVAYNPGRLETNLLRTP